MIFDGQDRVHALFGVAFIITTGDPRLDFSQVVEPDRLTAQKDCERGVLPFTNMYFMWHLLRSALAALTFPVTAIFGRRQSSEFTKCPRKRTRFAKADPGADLRHRERRPLQQALGAIHTARHVVAMRRRAEGLREGARKMIKAQIDEFCESRQRNLLREMLLDEFGHAFLLPRRQ